MDAPPSPDLGLDVWQTAVHNCRTSLMFPRDRLMKLVLQAGMSLSAMLAALSVICDVGM